MIATFETNQNNLRGSGRMSRATHINGARPRTDQAGGDGCGRPETHQGSSSLPAPEQRSGGGHPSSDTLMPDVSALQELHIRRRSLIQARIKQSNQLGAFARQMLGYQSGPAATDIKERASALVAAIGKGKPTDEDPRVVAYVADLADALNVGISALESKQAQIEKEMKKLVRKLPCWPWAEGVKGLGELTVASIIGETGDLNGYSNPAKVWKRMGLAVMDGRRQGNPGKDATAEDWLAHGYNPRRRSIMYVAVTNLMMQKSGYYNDVMMPRKAVELQKLGLEPGSKSAHANNRALRYTAKRLLKHLWMAWRGGNPKTSGGEE